MSTKFLVTFYSPAEAQQVRSTGCEILAEYPNSLLVLCSDAQQVALQQTGLEATVLEKPPVRVVGAEFMLSAALTAEDAAPVEVDPNRTAYYLVELVGPAKGEWLDTVRSLGGVIHGNLPGFVLLVGLLPENLPALTEQAWVETITPYRPAMKVSPKLRPDGETTLAATDLLAVTLSGDAEALQQVEISVFEGESVASIADQVRATGGSVLGQGPQSVTAVVPSEAIATLANQPGVEAIMPHEFPVLYNDRAAEVMGAPASRNFNGLTLKGGGQIVGIADSGLDTGNPDTLHEDFRGRVVKLVSWGTDPSIAPYTNDPPGKDDGPADTNSGHGTHVAGSVLGSGATALAAGATTVPQGLAPEAQVYFQSVEQRVNWKTAEQLRAAGIPVPPNWPPSAVTLLGLPDDLNILFEAAYAGGARIHTNSWGADVAGQYTENSRAVDQFLWNHRDMVILFAAGNAGRDANANGVIDPDSIGSPATAKNCVTVGASENNRPPNSTPTPGINANWNALRWRTLTRAGHVSDNIDGMAAFSSRGPTDDGRIKPDVVAPGTNVLSTRSSLVGPDPLWGDLAVGDSLRGKYCWSGGTSMSTPLVAGAITLIRQYLVQRGHFQAGVKPSGALLKAFLVNGSVPMPGQFAGEIPAGQNSVSGFGRVNVAAAIAAGATQPPLFFDEPDQAIETGQIRTYRLLPAELTKPLKLTLVWTDAPSPVGTGGLQNQLYLQVKQPDGSVLNGDVTPFPTAQNNVQQVTIAAPVLGIYEIRVRGIAVTQQSPAAGTGPNPRQDFALAIANAIVLPNFRIGNLFSRSPKNFFGSTVLGVQVLKDNDQPASPADGIEVVMTLTQGTRTVTLDRPTYEPNNQYYLERIWRIQWWGFNRGTATVSAQVKFRGTIVAERSQAIVL